MPPGRGLRPAGQAPPVGAHRPRRPRLLLETPDLPHPPRVDHRFADGGPYAGGNLMLAIPPGMLVIDQDDDDGGPQAHRRPGRPARGPARHPHPRHPARAPPHLPHPAGVDGPGLGRQRPRNPLPPGIDLRVPGPDPHGRPLPSPRRRRAAYHPPTGAAVAGLPAAYLTAWTPPQPQPRPPAAGAGAAGPRRRRAATCTPRSPASPPTSPPASPAAATPPSTPPRSKPAPPSAPPAPPPARSTRPGDGQPKTRSWRPPKPTGTSPLTAPRRPARAIRSGLRNGLRNPRPLPDFTAARPRQRTQPAGPRPRPSRSAGQPGTNRPRAPGGPLAGHGARRRPPPDPGRRPAAADRRRAAITAHQQALERHGRAATPETAADAERTRAAAHAAHEEYTHDGRHVTGRHDAAMLRWAAGITAQRACRMPGNRSRRGRQRARCRLTGRL